MLKKSIIIFVSFIFITKTFALTLNTNAFTAKADIPQIYTCDGKKLSPELDWSNVPANTQSFALILSDPDAPHGTFYHWVLYNIPKDVLSLTEAAKLPTEITIGKNTAGEAGYFPPCPPSGKKHHYIFTLYALDKNLKLRKNLHAEQVLNAIQPYIIAKSQLSGTYQR